MAVLNLARASVVVVVVGTLAVGAGGCAATCEAAAEHVRGCAEDDDDAADDDEGDSPAERAEDVKTTCDAVPEAGRGPLADCLVAASCEDIVATPDPVRLCAAPPSEDR